MKKIISANLKEYLKEPYSRILIPDAESGTYTAEILEFSGCIAQGSTPQEAYEKLEEATIAWIEAALDLGQEVPPPSMAHGYGGKIALRLPKSLHRQVAMAAERDESSVNQFIVAAIGEKLGAHNLYEKFIGRVEQCFIQSSVTGSYVTAQAVTGFAIVTGFCSMNYGVVCTTANLTPPSFPIPSIDFSKKEGTANA